MKHLPIAAIAVVGVGVSGFAMGDADAGHHTLTSSAAVHWGAPPPVLPPGAKFAVIDGDPGASGLVTVRIEMPPGYTIPPHWHPTDEHVTVLSGSLSLGMGDSLDKSNSTALKVGGYAVAPAKMHHYAWSNQGATIQLHMMGPFAITYVNQQDDPTRSKAK